VRKAGFFKGGRFMAKGLIHGENGDTLQMESVFLIKLLSRFSRFELFHFVLGEERFLPRSGQPSQRSSVTPPALSSQEGL